VVHTAGASRAPQAVLVCNDLVVIGASAVAREEGVPAPESDVLVEGCCAGLG
jgi:DNA-binding LacI/PurR family transcriptional regulator